MFLILSIFCVGLSTGSVQKNLLQIVNWQNSPQ